MPQADRYAPAIIAGKATAATLIKAVVYAMAQGEIAISTDTERFFIGDSTYHFKHGLAWLILDVMVLDGDVVCFNNEVVWKGY